MKIRLMATTIIVLFIALTTSCGPEDLGDASTINIDTTVKANGDVTQKINMETISHRLTVEQVEGWFDSLKQEGWEVTATTSSGVVTLAAEKEFSKNEFQSYIPSYQMVTSSLEVKNYIVYKKYILNISLRALVVDEEGAVQDSLLQIIDLALTEQRLTTSWTINMPGTIIDTNANEIIGNSATWDIDEENISQGVPFIIVSTSAYWPGIAGVMCGMILIVALLLIKKRRKNKNTNNPVVPDNVL
jgi:LPXTG-motif cell wall-anchored protein